MVRLISDYPKNVTVMDLHEARQIPPIHSLLDREDLAGAIASHGREAVLRSVRAVLEEAREAVTSGRSVDLDPGVLSSLAARRLVEWKARLRPVINASGVLLHTGLGRAPLAAEAVEAVDRVVRGYCNLEFDLETGRRGERTGGVADLLREFVGAEDVAVVNNNAAATLLALRALAGGREVIVSRGQLVEIGGSFRLPEICEVSGARLREVGTTNKTRLSDYERAIGPDTAALLRVHPSNFRVVGFTESVAIADLVQLGRSRGLMTIDDIGSGAIDAAHPPGISGEPTLAEGLAAGADLVLFSGDKLLGGPQCGLLVGTAKAIGRVKADPMMRALRVDKITLAALEATFHLALHGHSRSIPLWDFLNTKLPDLMSRAERLADRFRDEIRLNATAIEATAVVGGGSMPVEPIATAAVKLDPPWPGGICDEDEVARRLRTGEIAVVPRIHKGAILFDLRAVREEDDARIVEAVTRLAAVP